MKQWFRGFLVSTFVVLLSACGGGSSGTKQTAIEHIAAYAQEGKEAPTLQHYLDAGVVGVTAENLEEINALVEGLDSEDVDTKEEVQELVDGFGITIAPLADAGTDKNITQGQSITLDGSKSSDTDGTIVTYKWSEGETELGSTTSITLNTLSVGTHTITLTVTDDDGLSASDSVIVVVKVPTPTVTPAPTVTPTPVPTVTPTPVPSPTPTVVPNNPPTALITPSDNFSMVEGTDVNLSGEGSSDSDGEIVAFEWRDTIEVLGTDVNVSLSGLAVGEHNITLVVTDDGSLTDETNIIVTITAEDELITHHGVTYGTVTSPYTGKVWLDRNLGASQVCTALNDSACYGDYYQWGRNTDGHEKRNSSTTNTQATNINSAGSAFITDSSWNYNGDWAYSADPDGSLRSANWSKTDGSSVCPVGFRVPTQVELAAETTGAGVTDNATAFANFLKLPSSGLRRYDSATLDNVGSWGHVWSSSASGARSSLLYFGSGTADWGSYNRAGGRSVRCLRD